MPIIDHSKKPERTNEGRKRKTLVSGDDGAIALTLREAVLQPGSRVRLHVHPHEEAIVMLEGEIEFIVGDEQQTVGSGHTVLVPPGTRHGGVNNSNSPAKVFEVYPTVNPATEFLE